MIADALIEGALGPSSTLGGQRRADYLALPEEPGVELIYGRFYMSPSPTRLHQIVVLLLWRILDEIAQDHGGEALAAPLDVTLADHSVVQPDVLYLSAENREQASERVEGAPDLVVEVLSPATVQRDRGEKLQLYAASGIREYWLVDPQARQIEFLIAREGRFQVALAVDGAYRSEVLPEIELKLSDLWAAVDRRV